MPSNKEFLQALYSSDLMPSSKIIGSMFYTFDMFGSNSPSYKEISERINAHKNTAISAVKELVLLGFLVKETDHEKRKNVFFMPSELPEIKKERLAS